MCAERAPVGRPTVDLRRPKPEAHQGPVVNLGEPTIDVADKKSTARMIAEQV